MLSLQTIFRKGPASDPDALLQGMRILHMDSWRILSNDLELKRSDDSQRHELLQIVNKKVSSAN
jgi:hypothetical protein